MKLSLSFLLICSLALGIDPVHCAAYFFGKFFNAGGQPVEVVELLDGGKDEKKVVSVLLDESVDEERVRFEMELEAANLRSAQIKSARRIQYIASLPQEFDSMEMISKEASFPNRLQAKLVRTLEHVNQLIGHLSQMKYGHDQFSESEDEKMIDDSRSDSSNSSTYSDSCSITTDEMFDIVVGKPQIQQQKEQETEIKDDDTFEVINPEVSSD